MKKFFKAMGQHYAAKGEPTGWEWLWMTIMYLIGACTATYWVLIWEFNLVMVVYGWAEARYKRLHKKLMNWFNEKEGA